MMHDYIQRQELNDECDRFYSFWNRVKAWGKKDNYIVDQVILICCNKENYNEEDFQGVVFNLKKHIDKVQTIN